MCSWRRITADSPWPGFPIGPERALRSLRPWPAIRLSSAPSCSIAMRHTAELTFSVPHADLDRAAARDARLGDGHGLVGARHGRKRCRRALRLGSRHALARRRGSRLFGAPRAARHPSPYEQHERSVHHCRRRAAARASGAASTARGVSDSVSAWYWLSLWCRRLACSVQPGRPHHKVQPGRPHHKQRYYRAV